MIKKRILFVTWMVPYPTTIGGAQRTNLLYHALARLGHVDLVVLDKLTDYSTAEIQILRREFNMVAHAPICHAGSKGLWKYIARFSPKLVNRLAHNLNASRSLYEKDARLCESLGQMIQEGDYDLVVGRYAKSLAKVGLPSGKIPSVLDIDDLDSDVYASRLEAPNQGAFQKWMIRRHLKQIKRALPSFLKRLDHCWVANPENLNAPGLKDVSVLPNIPFNQVADDEVVELSSAHAKNVMVIGSYNHPPNQRGVDWFLDEVWPVVLKREPDAHFSIYGSGMSDSLRLRWDAYAGVNAVGFVDSVAEAYAQSAVSVCPVGSGAGTNIKVLESFSFGRPCVLTPAAARGFQDDACFAGLLSIGGDAQAIAGLIVGFIKNQEHARTLGVALRNAVTQNYSIEAFQRAVSAGVISAIENFKKTKHSCKN